MATNGYYKDPATRSCFEVCTSCFRCDRKRAGDGENCSGCSGRPDPLGRVDPHPDDICRCKEGVLQWRHSNNVVIRRRYPSNPFKGKIDFAAETEDERDWKAYVNEQRELRGIEDWDPIVLD